MKYIIILLLASCVVPKHNAVSYYKYDTIPYKGTLTAYILRTDTRTNKTDTVMPYYQYCGNGSFVKP